MYKTALISLFLLTALSGCSASEQFNSMSVAPGNVSATGGYVTRITTFREHGAQVDWSPSGRKIAYAAKNAAGYYQVHLANPDGSDDINLTANTPGLPNKHVGGPSWHPSERYLMVVVEKPEHAGSSFEALPGFAGYTDIWVVTSDGKHAYPLTNLPNDPDHGVLIPRFSRDGKRIAWSERVARPNILSHAMGLLAIKVADFVETPSGPKLENIRTFEPGGQAFYEVYGFSPDGSRVIFCSNMLGRTVWDQDIYTIDANTGGDIVPLTHGDYNEHAFYSRNGKAIVWMTNHESTAKGTDWWMMRPDGSGKHRLTYFNEPGHPEYAGGAVWAGLGSFSPDDSRFIGDIQTSLITQEATIKVIQLAAPVH